MKFKLYVATVQADRHGLFANISHDRHYERGLSNIWGITPNDIKTHNIGSGEVIVVCIQDPQDQFCKVISEVEI